MERPSRSQAKPADRPAAATHDEKVRAAASVLARMRASAKRAGATEMTDAEIDAEIHAARAARKPSP